MTNKNKFELEVIKKNCKQFDFIIDMKIINNHDLIKVGEAKTQLRELRLQAEKIMKPFVDMAYTSYKDQKKTYDLFLEPIKNLETTATTMIKNYEDEIILKAQQVNNEGLKGQAMNLINTMYIARPKNMGIVRKWKARVIDIDKLPKEYLKIEPDMSKLNGFANTTKGNIDIPGVEFYLD